MSAACKRCTRAVIWVVVDKSGKTMPVDADLRFTGKTRPTKQGGQAPEVAYVAQAALLPEGDRYVSHFATCPHAEEFRR